MKQTAVEFLINEFKQKLMGDNLPEWVEKIIQQAKEMEKEQLCYFYIKGAEAELNNPYVTNIEFYNKHFK